MSAHVNKIHDANVLAPLVHANMAMSLRVFSWIRVLERMAIRLKQLQLPRRTFTRWKIGKVEYYIHTQCTLVSLVF